MIEFLGDIGLFMSKAAIVVVAILIIIGSIASLRANKKQTGEGSIECTNITEELQHQYQVTMASMLDKKDHKLWVKTAKTTRKKST